MDNTFQFVSIFLVESSTLHECSGDVVHVMQSRLGLPKVLKDFLWIEKKNQRHLLSSGLGHCRQLIVPNICVVKPVLLLLLSLLSFIITIIIYYHYYYLLSLLLFIIIIIIYYHHHYYYFIIIIIIIVIIIIIFKIQKQEEALHDFQENHFHQPSIILNLYTCSCCCFCLFLFFFLIRLLTGF